MNSTKLSPLIGPLILTVLICAGFWLYTQWDLKRFEASLPTALPTSTLGEDTTAEQAARLNETTATAVMMPSVPNTTLGNSESVDAEQLSDTVDVKVAPADTADVDGFSDMFLQETADAVTSGDFADVVQDVPYDMEVVKAGFDDYNAYLRSDPEYAYQRLDDAFREQYGDDPDVDILVETIRHGNAGGMSIDEAIEGIEAMIRLVSKVSPPEALESLQDVREILMEGKQMALEEGIEVEYKGKYHIGE